VFARVALSTSATDAAERIRVSPNFRRHVIFGANTDVGKTLVSTGLVRASLQNSSFVNYIKPLQCGGSDQAFVEKHISSNSNLHGQTLFSWETPASPHVASIKENLPKSDEEVLGALESALMDISKACLSQATTTTWIETAGGVLSPSAASPLNQSPDHAFTNGWGWSTQADLYRPFAKFAPVVLVGDGRLGGISATLSAMESLLIRGYDIAGMVVPETGYDNASALRDYASRKSKLHSEGGRILFPNPSDSIVSLPEIPPYPEPLHEWYDSPQVSETLEAFDIHLSQFWTERIKELNY
jgi:dethiobiotin synthetase/adenosylmethionine--8-amino-7-oxononanoate aminotransferase